MKKEAGVSFPEQVLTPADGAKMSIKRKKKPNKPNISNFLKIINCQGKIN